MKKIKCDVIQYKNITACLAAFHGCLPKELDSLDGHWEWWDADGMFHSMEYHEALHHIRARACFGWLENKKVIHVFIRKRATIRQIIRMFAHEIGHKQRPFHRTLAEEQKANKYADVALQAYDLAMEIFKDK